jgi:hypothetical protein
MTTQESTETRQVTRRFRWSGALVAVIAIIVIVGVAVLAWIMTNDEGPVAADEAQIEMTYTDDGTSFVGDHKITEGTVTVTFSNETTTTPEFVVFGYETGSEALAEELEFLEEGDRGVPSGTLPAAGFFDVDFDPGELVPGSHTWTMELRPGTYIFDVGPEDFMTTGLWRIAVIEVVAE